MTVAQRPDIPCKTSAVIPSDSDAVNSLIRQVRSCTDPAIDNLSERSSSENTTCEILNSLGADDEEIKVAHKLNDKLAQLVQDRWKASLSYSKLKEKSQHYLPPENAIFKVPLTNPNLDFGSITPQTLVCLTLLIKLKLALRKDYSQVWF